ncbi:hypothetical protein CK203_065498 [Vitis vinifera]|uniref:DUF295 domain-containing protein n=1 Tax=Vitis vinifera TaxID=29760 RepID=A0A438FPL0_VITVI|nr:hypothetical protein CK203_065498 [Vitis vinifera]
MVMADWSKMPDDPLKLIAEKLHSVEDYVRFGGVCKSWYSIFEDKECCCPSSKSPWLMLAEKENSEIRGFYSPLSGKVYEIRLPEVVGKWCWGSPYGCYDHLLRLWEIGIYKARPPNLDSIGSESGPVDDIIYFNGSFLAVNLSWEVWICDISGSQLKTIRFAAAPALQDVDEIEYEAKYLVESGGEIYMVTRNLYDTARRDIPYMRTWTFSVLKLDMCNKRWEEVENLDHCSFFLGNNHSFSTWASDYPEFRKNSIYFTDDYCGFLNIPRNFDMGIYNFQNTQIEHYPVGHDALSMFSAPLWIRPSFC